MNTSLATLHFLPNGAVQGVYTEAIDLTALGRLTVERLTKIEFDNAVQVWRVRNRRGRCLYVSPSRTVCLEWEREHLTHQAAVT